MKTIIEMAREADPKANLNEPYHVDPETTAWLERFAALVRADERIDLYKEIHDPLVLACKKMVADEREACAKVCDELQSPPDWNLVAVLWKECRSKLAAAIRARGNT